MYNNQNGGILLKNKKHKYLLQIKNITYDEAIDDYNKLKNTKCENINPNSHIGNTFLDYFFFENRLMTKSRKGINFIEFYDRIKKAKKILNTFMFCHS